MLKQVDRDGGYAINNQVSKDNKADFQRSREDLVVGRQAVLEVLRSGKPVRIMMADNLKGSIIDEINLLARRRKLPVKRLSKQNFQAEAGDISGNQGVAAVVAPFEYCSLEELISFSRKRNEEPFLIMLDHIEDPHNLGAVMRTADAGAVHGLIIPRQRAAGVTPTVRKVAAGAAERMPVALVNNSNQAVKILKSEGFWLYGAEANGDQEYFRADYKCSLVLIIGSEGKGISRLLRQNCDLTVTIPMPGAADGSLNVSAAAAVLVYAVLAQRKGWLS